MNQLSIDCQSVIAKYLLILLMLHFLILISSFSVPMVFADIDVQSTCIRQGNSILVFLPIELTYDQFSGEDIDLAYSKLLHLTCGVSEEARDCQVAEISMDRLSNGSLGAFDLSIMSSVKVQKTGENLVVAESDGNVFVVDLLKSSLTWRISKKGISAYGMAKCPEKF